MVFFVGELFVQTRECVLRYAPQNLYGSKLICRGAWDFDLIVDPELKPGAIKTFPTGTEFLKKLFNPLVRLSERG